MHRGICYVNSHGTDCIRPHRFPCVPLPCEEFEESQLLDAERMAGEPGNLCWKEHCDSHFIIFMCYVIYIYMHMIFSPCIYDHWLLLELWEVLSKGHHENHPNEGLDWFGCDAAKNEKAIDHVLTVDHIYSRSYSWSYIHVIACMDNAAWEFDFKTPIYTAPCTKQQVQPRCFGYLHLG